MCLPAGRNLLEIWNKRWIAALLRPWDLRADSERDGRLIRWAMGMEPQERVSRAHENTTDIDIAGSYAVLGESISPWDQCYR